MNFKIHFPTGYQVDDIYNYNIDTHIVLETGEVFWCTLFTLLNIRSLMRQDATVYFWATDMIIVEDLSKATIRKAAAAIIERGYHELACTKIGTIESVYSNRFSFATLLDMNDTVQWGDS